MRVWIAEEEEEDVDAVAGLMVAFRDWMGYSEPADDVIRRVVGELIRDPNTDYLLAAADDEPQGVCQLRYRLSLWTGADDCWLEDLYVSDEARRNGVGRALVEAAVERARARGCKRMELDASEQDDRAQRFYRSVGFTTEPKAPGRNLFLGRRL